MLISRNIVADMVLQRSFFVYMVNMNRVDTKGTTMKRNK